MNVIKMNDRFWPSWPSFFDDEALNSLASYSPSGIKSDLDVYETDDAVIVEAVVAGIPEDKVDVSIEGNVLSVCAELEETEEEKEKKKTVYKQTMKKKFNYTYSLPKIVDSEKAEAEVNDGIVKVTIPKVAADKPKKIAVKKKK